MSIGSNVDWQKRAQESIAQGALTNSKRPECLVKGVYPTHLTSGRGVHVWDVENRRYIDFICGLGTNLLGYGFPDVANAIAFQASQGTSFSLATTLEVEAAEKLKEFFPFVEQLKFLKTGSEACSAAIRIARAHTGRSQVLSDGYHGWHDDFVSLTPPATGVPARSSIELLKSLGQINRDTAAVIVEPVSLDASPERRLWLEELAAHCRAAGALLIFDEVITGLRFRSHGVCNAWSITPDLICLGKSLAGGMPLAAVGGKRAVMSGAPYFVSSTYAGEAVTLAAALRVLKTLHTTFKVETLWRVGEEFKARFNRLDPLGELQIEGYATRGVFKGDPMTKALFWQEACKAGILFGPSWFFAFPHIELVESVLSVCKDILVRIRTGSVRLEGELPATPFAQKMREKNG